MVSTYTTTATYAEVGGVGRLGALFNFVCFPREKKSQLLRRGAFKILFVQRDPPEKRSRELHEKVRRKVGTSPCVPQPVRKAGTGPTRSCQPGCSTCRQQRKMRRLQHLHGRAARRHLTQVCGCGPCVPGDSSQSDSARGPETRHPGRRQSVRRVCGVTLLGRRALREGSNKRDTATSPRTRRKVCTNAQGHGHDNRRHPNGRDSLTHSLGQ